MDNFAKIIGEWFKELIEANVTYFGELFTPILPCV